MRHSAFDYNLIAEHDVFLVQTFEVSVTLSTPVSQTMICPSTYTSTCPPHPLLLPGPKTSSQSFPLAHCTTLNALKTQRHRKTSLMHQLKKSYFSDQRTQTSESMRAMARMAKFELWKACDKTEQGWPATGLVTTSQVVTWHVARIWKWRVVAQATNASKV